MKLSAIPLLLLTVVAAPAAEGTGGLAHRDDLTPDRRDKAARVLARPVDPGAPQPFEQMSGGATTSRGPADAEALTRRAANLRTADHDRFLVGNALFRKLWTPAPSSTLASDGLGPMFNARSCDGCHINDGRGRPLEAGAEPVGLLYLLGDAQGRPDPVYGRQIQPRAAPGLAGEARPVLRWHEETVALGDGTVVGLRRPTYGLEDPAYGPLDRATRLSPRIAPPMIGLGLLEAIHEGDVLALADADDADGDGISGRPNRRERQLGRFGWKAGAISVATQTAEAFGRDLGLSNPLFPSAAGDCTPAEAACLAMPQGVQKNLGPHEISDEAFAATVFYSRHLAVPVRRNWSDPQVLAGKRLFGAIGCAACHHPAFVTRADADPALAFQLIWPYTDLLLHDMGEDLADGTGEGEATGREWRTPPLWGLGLASTADPHVGYLHDGRARTIEEAVLWHGGEGKAARDAYAGLPSTDRAALVAFLNSL